MSAWYTTPDVSVYCGPPEFTAKTAVVEAPIVVVTALDTPLAWPEAVAVTEVLSVPPVCEACAVTVKFEAPPAPGDRVTDPGVTVEALKFVLFVSEAARLNVVLVQDVPLSLFLMLIVYVSLPPLVIPWEDGVILTVGAFAVQTVEPWVISMALTLALSTTDEKTIFSVPLVTVTGKVSS